MTRDDEPAARPDDKRERLITNSGFWQALAITVIGGAFAVAGGVMVIDERNLEGWSVLLFFGAVAAVGLWQLSIYLPHRASSLVRDAASGAPAGVGDRKVLKAARTKWLLLATVFAAFSFAGYVMLQTERTFIAWGTLIFFSAGLAISIVQLTWLRSTLVLAADTFQLSSFGRNWSERWDECSDFAIVDMQGGPFVGYDRAKDQGKKLAAVNQSLAGKSAMLPDTFGLKAYDLAELMNAYREAAIERSWLRHAETVEETKQVIIEGFEKAGEPAEIIDFDDLINLPEDMPPWPSFIVATPRTDDAPRSRRLLICVDVLNPYSRWFTTEDKQAHSANLLGAEELQIISPDDKSVRRFVVDTSL